MAILHDRTFSSSKTSLEIKVFSKDDIACQIRIIFNFGNNNPLYFDFTVLCDDIKTFYTLILNRWPDVIHIGVWDSTEPAFSFSIIEHDCETMDQMLYRFQFWIDSGEFNTNCSTRSGIGITIYQDKKTIEQFALLLKEQFEHNDFCFPNS